MTSLCQTGVNQMEQKCHDLISTFCNKLYPDISIWGLLTAVYMARGVYYVTWNFSVPHYRCANIRENSIHCVWHYPWLQIAAGKSWTSPPQTRETAAHRCAGAGSSWGLSIWVFKTKSHSVAQVCLKLTAALFQPPKYWDYRHEMSYLVQDWGFEIRGKS